ncbi:MAG: helix-turn-helix domain-containing protein [Alistipes finegoldii]
MPLFQEEHLPESLDLYQRVSHRARRADDRGDRRLISEISTRCGFHNISNFNHAFRERIGSAPGEYRRKFARR